MEMTPEEFEAFVEKVRDTEQRRETAHRLQEDFKVFISYSHADEAAAQRITDLLDGLKRIYVIDKKEVGWGDDIKDFAAQKIAQCTHYLLILSETSAKSKWCALEFGIALGARKEVLLFRVSDAIEVPSYAATVLATGNIDVVRSYFREDLIRPEAVDKFIAEIINDRKATLSEFKRVDMCGSDYTQWDAPDRMAIESEKRGLISVYIDDYGAEPAWRLASIELSKPFNETAAILRYSSPGWEPARYELSYRSELKGVVVTPPKERSRIMGMRPTDSDGAERLIDRSPSVTEQLALRGVYGWPMSSSFWERAFETLKGKLPR